MLGPQSLNVLPYTNFLMSTSKNSDSEVDCSSGSKVKLSKEAESEHVRTHDNKSENCNKSKVVVQVLPSVHFSTISALAECNAFSRFSVKSKGTPNVSCNSDSVRSETQPSSTSENSSSEESNVNIDEISGIGRISEFGLVYPSKNKQASRRSLPKRKNFNGTNLIYPGKGVKLLDIKHIAAELQKSSPQVIRILHYILFGMYGLVSTESLLQQSRENILQFSGFSFAQDSDMYIKKTKSLSHLPYPLLVWIHKILLNYPPLNRINSVDTLIQFLLKPTVKHSSDKRPDSLKKELSENEIKKLKNEALEANPVVLLKRLKENFAEENLKGKNQEKPTIEHKTLMEDYVKPPFIHNGTGLQLKSFPEIVNNVQRTRRRIVNLLHSLLYGRPGSDTKNRQNILEFNGFTSARDNFLARKMTFLKRLRTQELWQLCDVFSLRIKTENKNRKILKLLQFLACPEELNPHKTRRKRNTMKWSKMNDDFVIYGTSKGRDLFSNKKGSEDSETVSIKPSVKLRDFDTIRSKVECATPDFLFELNDLLYVKPCDNSEIHQRILDFTSFTFTANSFDFDCRKTLMHYMDMKTVRKIADLLDIEDWEDCRSHQDLSKNILNFLMNMQLPDKKKKFVSNLRNKRLKTRPNIMRLYSNKQSPKSRSSSPENCDSTYASEEINENDCDLNIETPFTYYKNNAAKSGYNQHKNGLFPKQDSIQNDSTPLFEFLQHPTDNELYHQIQGIISSAPISMTLGDLVKEVLKCYPNYNLHYRIDFIRKKALEVLQELRESIVIFPE